MAHNLRIPKDLFLKIPRDSDKIDIQEENIVQTDEKKEKIRQLELQNNLKEEKILQAQQDRTERLKYTDNIFNFVKNYIKWVLGIYIVYQLLMFCPIFRDVPTAPMVALLGTTSVIVIGLLATVVRYLFPNGRK